LRAERIEQTTTIELPNEFTLFATQAAARQDGSAAKGWYPDFGGNTE